MNSDPIVNRITDLIKFTGITDNQIVEELIDHYLTRIEEEVGRGVNAQKAVRETYQEIANLDPTHFGKAQKTNNNPGLMLFILLFVGIAFYLFNEKQIPNQEPASPLPLMDISIVNPPSGNPLNSSNLSVSSEFGLRTHPLKKQRELHKGIDICAKTGTPVLSTGDGIVKSAGFTAKAGNFIVIEHEGNFITKYYHLSKITVNPDEKVKKGQPIGKVGNSGLSLMPHLHYEVLKDEVPMNPRACIKP